METDDAGKDTGMTHKRVDFDKAKLRRFKRAYHYAVSQKQESFTFDGNEYMTAYAMYLIEYLASELR